MAVVWSYPVQPFDTAAGTAVSGGTTLTAGTPLPQPVAPPFSLNNEAGAGIRMTFNGEYTTSSATPTLTIGFYISAPGTAIGSATALAVTTGMTLGAITGGQIYGHYLGTIRALSSGSSGNGTIHGAGFVMVGTSLTAAMTTYPLGITQAGRTVSTVNTLQNNQFDIGVTLSSTTGTPSVTITDLNIEIMG